MGPREQQIERIYREMLRIRFRRWRRSESTEDFRSWLDLVIEKTEMMELARTIDVRRAKRR